MDNSGLYTNLFSSTLGYSSKQITLACMSAVAAASRCLPAASTTALVLKPQCRFPLSAIRNAPSRAACSSIQSASVSAATTHLVRITHPFHPLSGKQFACVGERQNRSGRRLLLQVDDATVRSVPPQWTDLVAPDPEIIMGEHRALFRMADLLELVRLVDQLGRRIP